MPLRREENRAVLADLNAAIARLGRRNPSLDQESLRFLAQHSTESPERQRSCTCTATGCWWKPPRSGQWDAAALIETDNAGDVFNPQIAVSAAGDALAVWGQSNGTRTSIRANRYTFGGTWGTALSLENN